MDLSFSDFTFLDGETSIFLFICSWKFRFYCIWKLITYILYIYLSRDFTIFLSADVRSLMTIFKFKIASLLFISNFIYLYLIPNFIYLKYWSYLSPLHCTFNRDLKATSLFYMRVYRYANLIVKRFPRKRISIECWRYAPGNLNLERIERSGRADTYIS